MCVYTYIYSGYRRRADRGVEKKITLRRSFILSPLPRANRFHFFSRGKIKLKPFPRLDLNASCPLAPLSRHDRTVYQHALYYPRARENFCGDRLKNNNTIAVTRRRCEDDNLSRTSLLYFTNLLYETIIILHTMFVNELGGRNKCLRSDRAERIVSLGSVFAFNFNKTNKTIVIERVSRCLFYVWFIWKR